MAQERKALERRHLDIFLDASGLKARVGEIIESERPDFLLIVDGVGRVALEHTQPRDSIRAAHGHLLVDLVREVRRELEERGLSLWIHLTLDISEAEKLAERSGQKRVLARELVAMIASDREKVATRWAEYEPARMLDVAPSLAALRQVHVSEGTLPIATWGTKPLYARLRLLESAISSKAEKLDDYRRHVLADEFWLLVVSGPGLGCLPAQLAPELRIHEGFRQIHVIDEYRQHWFRLA